MYCFVTEYFKKNGTFYYATLLRPLANFLLKNHLDVYLFNFRDSNSQNPQFLSLAENRLVSRSFSQVKAVNINYWGKRIPELDKCFSLLNGYKSFFNFLKTLQKHHRVHVVNNLERMEYNLCKNYLIDFRKTLPFIPTEKIKSFDDLLEKLAKKKKILCKPLLAERSKGAAVFDRNTTFSTLQKYYNTYHKQGFILQPYLESFKENGERKLCFVNGKYIFTRLEKSEEVIVHFDGGTHTSFYEATDEEIDLGHRVYKIFGQPVYFRLDLIEHEGQPLINEIELINPDWYYEFLQGQQRILTLDRYNREMLKSILKWA